MATYNILGKQVGVIGYGLMGLTTAPEPLTDEVKFAAIRAALDAGCNYFNAADFYGPPDNNTITTLQAYFERYPEDGEKIALNFKIGMTLQLTPDASKESISRSIDNILRTLGPFTKIHQIEPARKDLRFDFEKETLAAVDSFVKAGKINGLGLSEVNASTIRSAAKSYKITSVEVEFSLFNIDPLTNGVLEACGELDIPVLAYSPLGKGFLTGQIKSPEDIPEGDFRHHYPRWQGENFHKNIDLVSKVEALAKRKNCTPGQIAINWLLSVSKRPGMPKIIPIPGSVNPQRIKENATIVDLTAEDVSEIDKIIASFAPVGDRYPAFLMNDLNL